jgi:hypothetical protein
VWLSLLGVQRIGDAPALHVFEFPTDLRSLLQVCRRAREKAESICNDQVGSSRGRDSGLRSSYITIVLFDFFLFLLSSVE